jgi:hypothetical protein
MKIINRVIGSSIGVAAVLALNVSTIQANVVTDPGYEAGTPGQPNPIPIPGGAGGGWAVFNGAGYSTAHPETGTYSLLETEGAGSAWNFEASYQVVGGITAGQSYTLTGDFMATTALSSYNPVFIQLTFLNSSGTDIGTVQTGGSGALAVQYGAPAIGTWYTATVTATAPAGAAYVAPYLAMMENGATTATETIYWDKTSLTAAPEPSTLALMSLSLAAVPFYLIRRRKI